MCRWRDVIASSFAPISPIRNLFSQNQHEIASTGKQIVMFGRPEVLSQSLPSSRHRLSFVYQKSLSASEQTCNVSKVWIQLTQKLMRAIYSTAVPLSAKNQSTLQIARLSMILVLSLSLPISLDLPDKGLLRKRLEEDLCWIVPLVLQTTQSVKGLNWTCYRQEICRFVDWRDQNCLWAQCRPKTKTNKTQTKKV